MAYIPKKKQPAIEAGIEPNPVLDKIWIGRNSAPNSSVFYGHQVGNDDIEYVRKDALIDWAKEYMDRLSDGCVGQRHALRNLIDKLNNQED